MIFQMLVNQKIISFNSFRTYTSCK